MSIKKLKPQLVPKKLFAFACEGDAEVNVNWVSQKTR